MRYTGSNLLELAMPVIRLQSIDPEKNRYREYCLTVSPDLFGEYFLTIHWGRIGSDGDLKRYWHSSEEAAYKHAARIVKKRIKRGYAFTQDSMRI